MAEVIHITENANQAAARVSAVSLSELGVLIGNTLPTADPATVGNLWNDAGVVKVSPTPVAIADFKNGIYSIGGVPKTVDEMFEKQDPAGLDPTVVPGQGLQVVSTSNAEYMYCQLKSTPELFAAVSREFVGVAEFTSSTSGDPLVDDMLVSIASTDLPDFNFGWAWNYETLAPYTWDEIVDFSGVYGDQQPLTPPYTGHFKNAYMFCEELLAASMNGAPSRVPAGTPQANLSANAISVGVRAWSVHDTATTTTTLHSLHFYPEYSPDFLPTLSAL